jgi:paraquat-inducible protein A
VDCPRAETLRVAEIKMNQAPRRTTLAMQATGWQKLLGPALLIVLFAFPYALSIPLLTTRAFFSRNEVVLVRVAYDLFYFDKFLFVIVFVFGMLFPFSKMIVSILCWYRFDLSLAERCNRKLFFLGKLSMLDVMLLALFVIAFKGVGIGAVQIQNGLYLYGAIVVGSLLLNKAMDSSLEQCWRQAAGPDPV